MDREEAKEYLKEMKEALETLPSIALSTEGQDEVQKYIDLLQELLDAPDDEFEAAIIDLPMNQLRKEYDYDDMRIKDLPFASVIISTELGVKVVDHGVPGISASIRNMMLADAARYLMQVMFQEQTEASRNDMLFIAAQALSDAGLKVPDDPDDLIEAFGNYVASR